MNFFLIGFDDLQPSTGNPKELSRIESLTPRPGLSIALSGIG
jgi:hypothetical protein